MLTKDTGCSLQANFSTQTTVMVYIALYSLAAH